MMGKSSGNAFSVGLGLTNECDLACAHCYRDTGRIDRLSLDDVRRVCENVPVRSVNLGTGENGLHPEFQWREGPLTFDLPASWPHESTREQAKSAAKAAFLTRDELKQQEREAIINALKQTNGKVSGPGGAAKLLGMKPSTLASRIPSLGINRRMLS